MTKRTGNVLKRASNEFHWIKLLFTLYLIVERVLHFCHLVRKVILSNVAWKITNFVVNSCILKYSRNDSHEFPVCRLILSLRFSCYCRFSSKLFINIRSTHLIKFQIFSAWGRCQILHSVLLCSSCELVFVGAWSRRHFWFLFQIFQKKIWKVGIISRFTAKQFNVKKMSFILQKCC